MLSFKYVRTYKFYFVYGVAVVTLQHFLAEQFDSGQDRDSYVKKTKRESLISDCAFHGHSSVELAKLK